MNILLSRTDRVGDLILSTPAIASLRRSFPHARLTMVCSSYNRVVVEHN
ncbi:MAG: lipopolysaccharide heptosyltransferase family protein, partial [Candidatus Eremiobacteraeota bacterium]|nr:lipopolysaccharide heptosyltransferase family protein [Candidatus Eremiobacteraeota bacterium]